MNTALKALIGVLAVCVIILGAGFITVHDSAGPSWMPSWMITAFGGDPDDDFDSIHSNKKSFSSDDEDTDRAADSGSKDSGTRRGDADSDAHSAANSATDDTDDSAKAKTSTSIVTRTVVAPPSAPIPQPSIIGDTGALGRVTGYANSVCGASETIRAGGTHGDDHFVVCGPASGNSGLTYHGWVNGGALRWGVNPTYTDAAACHFVVTTGDAVLTLDPYQIEVKTNAGAHRVFNFPDYYCDK